MKRKCSIEIERIGRNVVKYEIVENEEDGVLDCLWHVDNDDMVDT